MGNTHYCHIIITLVDTFLLLVVCLCWEIDQVLKVVFALKIYTGLSVSGLFSFFFFKATFTFIAIITLYIYLFNFLSFIYT